MDKVSLGPLVIKYWNHLIKDLENI
ncbi:hypothetical protein LCGC14_2010100, partial [marine sediment metagenome]